ncbi:MAG: hypothetical protein ACK6AD_09215 [Cyanobacteriota bacterium]|jgi:hypothetical protein
MKGRWLDASLSLAVALGIVGFIRSLMILSPPAAADLPEPLRQRGLSLTGYRSLLEPSKPAWRERDVAWGPTHRYRFVPVEGTAQEPPRPSLLLELVVRRHRKWYEMALPKPSNSMKVVLTPQGEVMIGNVGKRMTLQTCLAGRGQADKEARAAVDQDELLDTISRWNDRHDPRPSSKDALLQKDAAVQAGLRVNKRWECLLVTLQLDTSTDDRKTAQRQLLTAWNKLTPALNSWGEEWKGVSY